MTPAQRFAAALRRVMAEQDVTVAALVAMSGVHQSTVVRYRSGGRPPRLESGLAIADALASEALATLVRQLATRTCEICGREFIGRRLTIPPRFCSYACRQINSHRRMVGRRQERREAYADLVDKYRRTVDAFCRACSDATCPDAACPIQVANLSPLPLARGARRVA